MGPSVGIAELVIGMNFVDLALTGGSELLKKLVFKVDVRDVVGGRGAGRGLDVRFQEQVGWGT